MSFDKNSIYALLNSKNIQFSYTEHRPVYSMEESDTLKLPAGAVICKNLFLRNNNGKQHFLLTVPAATPVDLKELAVKLAKIFRTAVWLSFPLRPVERYKQKRYLRQQ